MHKVVGWFREHRVIAVLSIIVLGCVGGHYFLNWRAERRWQTYAAEAQGRGVKLALTDFERPEIPDAENSAALPMMRSIFATGAKSPMELPAAEKPSFGNPLKDERLDWEKWRQYFKSAGFIAQTTDSPPRDVLRALEHYAPQFEEWSQWKTRPRCRFALDLKAGAAMPLPHLSLFQHASQLFSLRLRARLALGDSSGAYDDFRAGLQAYFALVEEPVLISGLVRTAVLVTMLNGLHDGLAEHAWAESELRQIHSDLARVSLPDDYTLAFSSERGFGNASADELLAKSPMDRAKKISSFWESPFAPEPLPGRFWIGALVPDRLIRDNQLRDNRFIDQLLQRVSADRKTFDPDAASPSGPDHLTEYQNYYFFLFALSAPIFDNVAGKYQLMETRLDQARAAIALERFRLVRGAIPESLAELIPDFMAELPRDVYTHQPMIYRRRDHGGYILYSVGPNRRDDGGTVDPKLSAQKQLDWVWICSAAALPENGG